MQKPIVDFLKPDSIKIKRIDGNHSRITLEPLERGFGYTLGNALRRILLSSMPGCAVTDVKIQGVLHEYSTLDGVQEDVIDILMNLKNLVLKMHTRDEAMLHLHKSGPGSACAGDIKLTDDVDVVDPKYHIATLGKGVELKMELIVKQGRGYETVETRMQRSGKSKPGIIHLDASYSPIRKVLYSVEDARKAERTDLDRLILEVQTDGSIDAESAVRRAATILSEQISAFVNLDEIVASSKHRPPAAIDPILMKPIEDLELTTRSHHWLKEDKINLIGDLIQHTEQDLMETPNLGKKSLTEIKEALAMHNLELGSKVDNWPPPALDKNRTTDGFGFSVEA